MVTTTMPKNETFWNSFQEPRCPAYIPNSYMLLLSALDQGWKITKVELAPSWDQHGFIYLVTLNRPHRQIVRQLILPQNTFVMYLLQDYASASATAPFGALQTA
jgi:hypothetical protein